MIDLRYDDELYRFLTPTTTKPRYYIATMRQYIRFYPLPDDQTGIAMNIAFTSLLNRLNRTTVEVLEARDMLIDALDAIRAMRPNDFKWRRSAIVTVDGEQYTRTEDMFVVSSHPSSVCTCKEFPLTECTATFHPGII